MNRYKIICATFFIALFATGLTGCLKDDDFDNGSIQSLHTNGTPPKVVEIKLTAADVSNFFVASFDNSDNDTVVELIPVNLATAGAAPEDLHITLTPKQSLVDDYNAEHGTIYGDPSALYTLEDGGVVTIPKGSYTGYLKIKFKPSDFLGADWAVGFEITAIEESGYVISGNLNKGIVAIGIKNNYDGIYHATGYFDHPSLGGDYDAEWAFATTGVQSNQFQLITTAIFSVFVDVTVDPVTNLLTIESSSVAVDPYDPAKNYYDPATRTFYFDWGYTTSAPRHVTGTAVYDRPR